MFDLVRKHTKVMQLLLFVLIVPSFVLFGLEGYTRMQEKGETVAKVDGRNITQSEWDEAHRREVDRIRQQMPNLDAALFDTPEAKRGSLDRMVRDQIIAAAARDANLGTSDQKLARELQRNEMIASLRGPDGKLDMERYRQLVASQGMTPEMFENSVRAELSQRQVLAALSGSALALSTPANVALGAWFEKREAQVARFNASDYVSRVNPTDAELEAFYKANGQLFQAPEQASVEYVVLDLDAVRKGITVSDADLKTYFEQNSSRLAGKEERRARHILITLKKDAAAADKARAKDKAEELLAAVKKNHASFDELAKKESQDPGSAAQGGDLDFFSRGAMTKSFEDAVFAMQKGETRLVETEFGFHVVQVTDIRAPKQRSFEEMRAELEEQLKRQQAQSKYAESAEIFSNTVYEQSDSLKPVADKLKLEVRKAEIMGRQPQAGAPAPLSNPKFLAAIFSPDATEKKRNTEAVEFGPNQMVAGRVAQYTPARTRPFAEVKDQVRARFGAQRSAELAKQDGQQKLAQWKANPAAATLPLNLVLSREGEQQQPQQVVEAALRADPAALPAILGVDLGSEGYAVVKVIKVIPREQPAGPQERAQYTRAWAAAEQQAYLEYLKQRYKVQITPPKPAANAQ